MTDRPASAQAAQPNRTDFTTGPVAERARRSPLIATNARCGDPGNGGGRAGVLSLAIAYLTNKRCGCRCAVYTRMAMLVDWPLSNERLAGFQPV